MLHRVCSLGRSNLIPVGRAGIVREQAGQPFGTRSATTDVNSISNYFSSFELRSDRHSSYFDDRGTNLKADLKNLVLVQ